MGEVFGYLGVCVRGSVGGVGHYRKVDLESKNAIDFADYLCIYMKQVFRELIMQ